MLAVFVCAIIFAYIRVKRDREFRTFCRERAANYARLEKLEIDRTSSLLGDAAFYKGLFEHRNESVARMRSKMGTRGSPSGREALFRVLESMEGGNARYFACGKQSFLDAQAAKARAKRFAHLSQQYAEAADRPWLPLVLRPLSPRRQSARGLADASNPGTPAEDGADSARLGD